MTNRLLCFLLIQLCLIQCFKAQDIKFFNQRPIKNIFIGTGGDGGIGSINKEKLRLMSFDLLMIQKIGLGYSKQWYNDSIFGDFISVPANLTFAVG